MSVRSTYIGGKPYSHPTAYLPRQLTLSEQRELRAVIEAAGQIVVLVSEDDEILAGHHALDINSWLGRWLQVTVVVATGARTEAQKLAAARAMCPWPQRLTRKEKRASIIKTLGMRPGKSDRTVAAEVSAELGEIVSDTTVLRVRRELLQKAKTKQKPRPKGASKRKNEAVTTGSLF